MRDLNCQKIGEIGDSDIGMCIEWLWIECMLCVVMTDINYIIIDLVVSVYFGVGVSGMSAGCDPLGRVYVLCWCEGYIIWLTVWDIFDPCTDWILQSDLGIIILLFVFILYNFDCFIISRLL